MEGFQELFGEYSSASKVSKTNAKPTRKGATPTPSLPNPQFLLTLNPYEPLKLSSTQ